MNLPEILVEKLTGEKAVLPSQATSGASGYDICSREKISIEAGKIARVATGLKLSIPKGLEAQVRPRSGLAAKHGITVLNAPGTIDSDYRGEVCVILINHGSEAFTIEVGMRIAQLVFARVECVSFKEVQSLDLTNRGEGGCGSTGH